MIIPDSTISKIGDHIRDYFRNGTPESEYSQDEWNAAWEYSTTRYFSTWDAYAYHASEDGAFFGALAVMYYRRHGLGKAKKPTPILRAIAAHIGLDEDGNYRPVAAENNDLNHNI